MNAKKILPVVGVPHWVRLFLAKRRRNFLPSGGVLAMAAAVGLFSPQYARAGNGQWTLTGWNNLGMHCMDDDYSVFSILPPFNTVNAQLMDQTGKLVVDPAAAGITMTYEAVADPDGSINSTSAGKTNFYEHAAATFGAALPVDGGLAGNAMPGPGNTPQRLSWAAAMKWFDATGIPITPMDDAGRKNPYPLMRLVAKSAAGAVLARAEVVLPVSDEMDCRACHASTAGPAARPAAGWVNDPSGKRDFRLNILRLHDERSAQSALFAAALAANGFPAAGLYDSVVNHATPVLCAKCHASEALGTGGHPGVASLTRSMHAKHAQVINPTNNLPLDSSASRNSCYQCHPGSATRCLRGAMGSAVAADGTMAMQCQSCHGGMNVVGAANRTGWLNEPTCQSCHSGDAINNAGLIRFLDSFDTPGHMRQPVNTRFATNADKPAVGLSLYRFSSGHGNLQCSACHGSTHAEFPASHRNDNLNSVALQGHAGVLSDCTACHATTPLTANGGPHGMHSISTRWTTDHADLARSVGLAECQKCHGTDYRGTVLSKALGDRSWSTKYGTLVLKRGMEVGCYECHNGPGSSNATSRQRLAVTDLAKWLAAAVPSSLPLPTTGTGPKLRVVQQPMHGTVGISGTTATYFPEAGYEGPDFFTWLSSDSTGYRDSLPAVASVTVGRPAAGTDTDGDGLSDVLEYALGLDPSYPSLTVGPRQTFELVGGQYYQALSYLRGPIRPPDVTTAYGVSGDLGTWTPATVMSATGPEYKARDTVSRSAAGRRFIRLQVVRPDPGAP